MMKRAMFFMLAAVLFSLAGCKQEPVLGEPVPRPVKTLVVDQRASGRQWTFAGTAEDALQTNLSFRVGGKIVEFPGDQIGRRFAKGELIARLDPADYELELRQAKANLEQIRANYVRAEADLARNEQLFGHKVISHSELDQVRAEYKSYKARLNATAKQLDIARKHLKYTTLRAPFDGWIGSVEANVHQNVASGRVVVSFNAGRQMKMFIVVPDVLISMVDEGDQVEVRFDALPGKAMKGKVMEVSVDSSLGSAYPVKIYLDNADKLVRSGMSGHVSFLGKTSGKERYYLPPVAVAGESDGTRSVWVVDPGTSTVRSRPVAVGQLTAHGLEILDGLRPGEVVVVRGVHRLKNGLKVRYAPEGAKG